MYYAGIGSRKTPLMVLKSMMIIGQRLAQMGYVLRSGAADGADKSFEIGCDTASGKKEIYIPWENFNKSQGIVPNFTDELKEIAKKYHPGWDLCSHGAKKLHMRNVCQVLGQDLVTPSDFIVCWTSKGKLIGGTAQALRIALDYNIPVYNLYNQEDIKILKDILIEK